MRLIPLSGNDAYAINSSNLVVGSSLIYDEHFTSCYNLNEFHPDSEYLSEEIAKRMRRIQPGNAAEIEFEFTNKPNVIMHISGTTVPFNLIHPYNYFHFLIESLPSLLSLISSNFIAYDNILISGVLHPNMLHALKLVTDNRFQIVELHLLNAVKSSKTIVAKDSFCGNELISGAMVEKVHYHQPNLIALRTFFEQRISTDSSQSNLKLFIIRQSGQRNIINRERLITAAQAQGFIAVEPEKLSFIQQVELFRSASVIVGPTGAWLANLLFVREGVKVKVLYPSTCRTAVSIWMNLGQFLGIAVSDYYFDDITLNQYQPIHSDFNVDMARFDQLLSE